MIEELIKEFSSKCTYVDCRVTNIKKETLFLENSETSNTFSEGKSYGVRVLVNDSWGFASTNESSDLRNVFAKALAIALLSAGKKKEFTPPSTLSDSKKYDFKIDPFSIDPVEKIKLMKDYESLLKRNGLVKNTQVIIQNELEKREVYAPSFSINQEFTNNVLRVMATGKDGSLIQSSSKYYSHLGGYEFISSLNPEEYTNEVLERLNRLLHAKSAKPERSNVVCDPQMTGLFFHEAVGHACEADSIINKASVFSDLKGKVIASEEINLFDDPTIEERGFYWYDDDGIKSRPTQLITNGKLTGFMHSLKTANELGEAPSGNGRCMNAEFNPIPRMSNTVLKPGKLRMNDLITEAGNGYLVKGSGGGVVDPITGQFSFAANECYRIVNGVVKEPLRDVNLAGSILEVLKTIRVASDLSKTHLTGTCGKSGQGVRVGEECPSILVKGVIVGGSA